MGDRYVIDQLIGQGGFSFVYLARHRSLENLRVAIKVLRADMADSDSARRRFLREGEAVATLSSPHVIRVSDAGSLPDERPYLVLEYCAGLSLDSLLHEQKVLDAWSVAHIARQILLALETAHARGIIHRDLKPENVFLVPSDDDGMPVAKVGDFGIARVSENSSGNIPPRMTATGGILCTPAYASPELLNGTTLPASDIYALGHMLAELLEGKPPYGDLSPSILICAEHLRPEPVPLGEKTQASPLAELVRKAVEKPLESRYTDARTMRLDLEALLPNIPRPEKSFSLKNSPTALANIQRLETTASIPLAGPKSAIALAPTVDVQQLSGTTADVYRATVSQPLPFGPTPGANPSEDVPVASRPPSPSMLWLVVTILAIVAAVVVDQVIRRDTSASTTGADGSGNLDLQEPRADVTPGSGEGAPEVTETGGVDVAIATSGSADLMAASGNELQLTLAVAAASDEVNRALAIAREASPPAETSASDVAAEPSAQEVRVRPRSRPAQPAIENAGAAEPPPAAGDGAEAPAVPDEQADRRRENPFRGIGVQ